MSRLKISVIQCAMDIILFAIEGYRPIVKGNVVRNTKLNYGKIYSRHLLPSYRSLSSI